MGRFLTRPVAGKTGTTDANRAAWFVGFTPNLAGAAFYVNPDAPNTSSVPNSKVPIEVFKRAMNGSLRYLPYADFVKPTPQRAYANSVYVDPHPTPDPKDKEKDKKKPVSAAGTPPKPKPNTPGTPNTPIPPAFLPARR